MNQKIFHVAQIGLDGPDLVAFTRILSMTQKRPRCYQLVEMKAGNHWDILVVKAGDKLGKSLQFAAEAEGDVGVLTIGQADEIEGRDFACLTPIMPAKLIEVLDQITVSILHYAPELEINDSGEVTSDIHAVQTRRQQRQRRKVKALVVDDSEPVRKQMGMSLEVLGIDADFAENSDEAFLALNEGEYDIIFLDVVMPGMDGFDVCKNIKRNPKTKHIPVIMLTGKGSRLDKVRGSMVGCQSYLTKPVDNSDFQAVIEEFVN